MEVFTIRISIHSDKMDVIRFLEKLFLIINNDKFDIDNNLIFINKQKPLEKERYSTPYTMLDLNYNSSDVVLRLKELSVHEYSETLFDNCDENPLLLFVFGKDINCRTVYIKLKIKESDKKVLCLSFHYAEYLMSYPYR